MGLVKRLQCLLSPLPLSRTLALYFGAVSIALHCLWLLFLFVYLELLQRWGTLKGAKKFGGAHVHVGMDLVTMPLAATSEHCSQTGCVFLPCARSIALPL